MPKEFDKCIKDVGDVLKTAPTIYEDALQPTVKEVGKFTARIPRAINAAFSGLDKWILNREYNIEETKKLLEEKLANINPDKIVEPETYVAIPAIQAISYSMNNENLRNLYANLLARAMNVDTKDFVHPAFVEIIKQMSPIDALVFKIIMERENDNPLIDLIYEDGHGNYSTIQTNITDINIASPEIVSVSIDNLARQKLIFIPEHDRCSDENSYYNLINSNYYIEQHKHHPDMPTGFKFTHRKKIIDKTGIGKTFYEICVINL